MDVVETIRRFNAGRDPELLQSKFDRMRSSPFVFMRGACHLFYERLAEIELPPTAPLAWACGDLHLENFGSYKGDNGLVYFDLNDFDESALAPASWDVVRLLASLLTAAKSIGIDRSQAQALCRDFIAAYAGALQSGEARWVERDTAQGLVQRLLDGLRKRKRVDFLDQRTEPGKKQRRRIVCDGKRVLPVSDKARARAVAVIEHCAETHADPRFFKVLDVARRAAGTGSLGLERYVVLVRGGGSPDNNYLLDVKLALPSSLEKHVSASQPSWASQAHRIVAAQARMQAVSTAYLHAVTRRGKSYVVRDLQPSEDRISLDGRGVTPKRLRQLLEDMGRMVAWAQLRSSGRQGSATADELIAFGAARGDWQGGLLHAAQVSARQAVADWKVFAKAV